MYDIDALFLAMEGRAKEGWSNMSGHMATLYLLARRQAWGPIVECGVGQGFSTIALTMGALEGGGSVCSYDFWPGARAQSQQTFAEVGLVDDASLTPPNWELHIESSIRAAGRHADGEVALLFIDSDHREEYTKAELRAWLPKMHPNGIICGHDYHLEGLSADVPFGVRKAVEDFMESHGGRYRLQVQDHDMGLFILWPR